MLTTTLSALHHANACTARYKVLIEGLGGLSYGMDTPITLLHILDLCGVDDAIWALRACLPLQQHFVRELACDYAARVLPIFEANYPDDHRPSKCIEVARRYARGEASEAELSVARDAAWNAVRVAAWAAARDAAWADDGYADMDTTGVTAREAERQWQGEHLRSLLTPTK